MSAIVESAPAAPNPATVTRATPPTSAAETQTATTPPVATPPGDAVAGAMAPSPPTATARQKEEDDKRRAAAETAKRREDDDKRREAEVARVMHEQETGAAAGQKELDDKPIKLAATEPAKAPTDLKPLVSTGERSQLPKDPTEYIKQVQTALKAYNCYGGKINGDPDDASAALNRFATRYKGIVRQIKLRSATIGDYEDWLNWSKGLEKFSCPTEESPAGAERTTPKKVQKQHEEPRETQKEPRRSREPTPNREPRQQREHYSAGRSSGSGGTMGGTGF